MMVTLKRTTSQDSDFNYLVTLLNKDLAEADGEILHAFYKQFNHTNKYNHIIVAYSDEKPIGCGVIKHFDDNTVEIKRMFVLQDERGKSVASKLLDALENWAKELGYFNCVLETGKKQKAAISFYTSYGYQRIPNYGQYKNVENSLCFKHNIK
ncbi:GNAT family N-acetyltransferase [Croceibacter atlanticus]|jgi:putative acetyltransferase|uniref:Predicted acetyltransferase n=1 Tax=Croceibacter atlanticus (strain ATCC BAA-628 / JCM 21780 / CIP 108009 / IAM 15332 / KCTC 12090 / HTCC2559) TaxID=216432 RepID=A3U730_CROAH|nr:GNAT family N-acetyltransferase [Croceibacter atlanticus]EAP88047.1 Predicted acetyltransferase [Croceibacter atlanticus HTCC2559]